MKTFSNPFSNNFKFFICLLTIVISSASYSNAQVRITMVDAFANEITLHNYGPNMVDVSSWWLCAYASTYNNIADTLTVTVQSGSLMIPSSGQVVLYWPTFTPSGADISLYNTNVFTDTSAMEDFMQWNGSWGRESVAAAKGIWIAGTWVNSPPPFTFIGGANDHDATFWINGCSGFIAASNVTANASCNGMCDGSAVVTATGGTLPYSYLWSNGNSSSNGTNLCAGTYTCTVTDINGCSAFTNITITEPTQLVTNLTITNASCNGFCDGMAIANTTGGTPGYSFLWSNGQITPTANGLCAGTYIVTVTDANGCSTSTSAIISQPNQLFASATTTDATCNGCTDGAATAAVTGGIPPYTYSWSPTGGTGSIATGLGAGTYSCLITDANGCTTVIFATINEPGVFFINCSVSSPIACVGDSGTVNAVTNGGTAPFTYAWTSGDTTATTGNLPQGGYTCVVTDANALTTSCFISIFPPTPINANITTSNSTTFCSGGSALLEATINATYTYQWKKWGNTIAGANASSLLTYGKGNYTVCITDTNGCTAISNTITLFKSKPTVVVTPPGPHNVCVGDTVVLTANVSGGTAPFAYQWFKWKKPISGETASTYTSIVNTAVSNNRGGFRVEVTDALGCKKKSRPNVQIIEVCRIASTSVETGLSLDVYPNPFSNNLSIELMTNNDSPVVVSVLDISGRLLIKQKININYSIIPLYLQELEQGIYILNAVQGEYKTSKKIIKTN